MRDMQDRRRAAAFGRVDVAQLQAQVLGHRRGAEPWRIARAEVGVDVVLRQAGVVERALGHVGVQAHDRQLVGLAGRVLVGADDVGFSVQAHGGFPFVGERITGRA